MQDPTLAGRKLLELEGLRGVAAAVVVAHHVVCAFYSSTPAAPAWRGLRAWHNGELAVRVFFVLSGLVLTLKFFQTGSTAYLASAAVRRYPRLLLPIAAAVALGFGVHAAGLTDARLRAAESKPEPVRADPWLLTNYADRPSATWAVREAVYLSFFDHKRDHTNNNVLWTMQAEFAGSLFVFGLAAAAGARRRRGLVYAAAAGVLVLGRHWYLLDFLCGLVLADVIALGWVRPGWWALPLLPLGVIAGDMPAGKLWNLGAPLVVAGAVFSPLWGGALHTRLPVFLGRVSFCLYLFHVPVLFALGCPVYAAIVDAGHGTDAAAVVAGLLAAAASLALAYLGTVTVDDGSVRLARWVDARLVPGAPPQPTPGEPRA